MSARLTARQRWFRSVPEAEVQRTLVDALDVFDYLSYHTHDSRRSRAGFPDLMAVHRWTHVALAFEVKSELGQLSPDQWAWAEALTSSAIAYLVVRPSNLDDALELIRLAATGELT